MRARSLEAEWEEEIKRHAYKLRMRERKSERKKRIIRRLVPDKSRADMEG